MATKETDRSPLKPLLTLIIAGGGATMMDALIVDRLGLGLAGSFGSGQMLLVAAGLLLTLIGTLGRRIVVLHRGVAIILLNTLILFACLELGAIILVRTARLVSQADRIAGYSGLPYYRA